MTARRHSTIRLNDPFPFPLPFSFALSLLACASSPEVATAPPAVDGLAAQLPSGADALVSVDVPQLRAWPGTAQLAEEAARLDALGLKFLDEVDAAALGA